jgi:hypothetical protein
MYNFLNSSTFPKSFIVKKHILKQLMVYSQIAKDNFKQLLENTSTSSSDDLMMRVGGQKRRRLNIIA